MQIAVLVPVLLTLSSSVLATCWFPDGQESTLDTACNPDAIVSSCCYDRQACLSNGLCVADPHNPAVSRTYRGTCTDRGWKSGNCVRHCYDDMHVESPVYSCNLTDVDSYCCYNNCKCENPFEVFTFPDPPSAVSTLTIILEDFTANTSAATSTSKTSVGAATLPASASASPTGSASNASALNSNSNSNGGSQSPLAIGIGLGVGLGLGIPIIFLAAFFLWRRKRANRPGNNAVKLSEFNEDYYSQQPKYGYTNEVPTAPEPAPATATEIFPVEKELAIQNLVELPGRRSVALTPSATSAGSEKQL